MKEPDFRKGATSLNKTRVAIIGLGLMGGSLALALREHCAQVSAVDRDPEVISFARERKIVDHISTDANSILPDADLVILALPVRAIIDIISNLPRLHPGSAVILDIGSTKREILKELDSLPERFDPLGGHPMCGKETSGLINADPSIFVGAPFAFTPLSRTSENAYNLAEEIAGVIGAHSLWLDAETHDEWTAATSHMPYLLSVALTLATPVSASKLTGPGFLDMSRLSGSDITMMLDILATNQDAVRGAIKRLKIHLTALEDHISCTDLTALEALLKEGVKKREAFIPK